MKYEVYIERDALKSLKKLPGDIRKRVKEALIKLENFPKDLDVTKLRGFRGKYRVRVGKYRIIIEIHGDKIYVIDILSRESAYKSKG